MIIQSPESEMPEPFRTYVEQRSESISNVMRLFLDDDDVQLCPRAILPEELIFDDNARIYGAVVDDLRKGYKSILYGELDFNGKGIVTDFVFSATQFAEKQFQKGNRVRIKDPLESDGKGQYTVETLDEVEELFASRNSSNKELVVMPHLDKIDDRISIGRIILSGIGAYYYVGREQIIAFDGDDVYGGTELALFSSTEMDGACEAEAERQLEIPHHLTLLGRNTLHNYPKVSIGQGSRVSVDIISGYTDNGDHFEAVVDITPRVSGATPAEVLALREMAGFEYGVCMATSRLIYDPTERPQTGTNFVDTDTLIINAKLDRVLC